MISTTTLFLLTLGLGLVTFIYGRSRAFSVAKGRGGVKSMHSLPSHYGMMAALWCTLPALAIIVGWKLIEPSAISSLLDSAIPQTVIEKGTKSVELYKNDISNLVESGRFANIEDPEKLAAATRLHNLQNTSSYRFYSKPPDFSSRLGSWNSLPAPSGVRRQPFAPIRSVHQVHSVRCHYFWAPCSSHLLPCLWRYLSG